MTVVLLITHYILNLRNTQNLVDRAWLEFVTPKSWHNSNTLAMDKWTETLEAVILSFSDIQLLTAVAILLCGYIQLPTNLSIYYWEIMIDLAWFSSLTHLATLTTLRGYFRERPQLAYWRVAIMGAILILLGTAIVNANNPPQWLRLQDYVDIPALCFFRTRFGDTKLEYSYFMIIVLLTFLFSCYITGVVRLFSPLSRQTQKWLRTKPGNLMKGSRCYAASRQAKAAGLAGKRLWCFCKVSLTLLYVVSKILCEIADSTLWEVSAPYLMFLWCTLVYPPS